MIGLLKNRQGKPLLIIDTVFDVDASVDFLGQFYDAVYIDTDQPDMACNILNMVNPITSYKCSYMPFFARKTLQGSLGYYDCMIDGYVEDINDALVFETMHRLEVIFEKYELQHDRTKIRGSSQLFSRMFRYLVSRDQLLVEHKVSEKACLGYVVPILELFHDLKMYHLREIFTFVQAMREYGYVRNVKFINKLHVCPHCQHHHIIYTESCPKCGSSNLTVEEVIHHFRCANVSPEHTYNKGGQLICPKCRRQLHHIGLDYDRPASVYSCRNCDHTFVSPVMSCICTNCKKTFEVGQLSTYRIIDYKITPEGIGALKQSGFTFSFFNNLYDNYLAYDSFQSRIKLLLNRSFNSNYLSRVYVAMFWVLDDTSSSTMDIRDALRHELCLAFIDFKVSYHNNIFYVYRIDLDYDGAMWPMEYRATLEKGMREVAVHLKEGERLCYTMKTTDSIHLNTLEDFFGKLAYVASEPDASVVSQDGNQQAVHAYPHHIDQSPSTLRQKLRKSSQQERSTDMRPREARIGRWLTMAASLILLIAVLLVVYVKLFVM